MSLGGLLSLGERPLLWTFRLPISKRSTREKLGAELFISLGINAVGQIIRLCAKHFFFIYFLYFARSAEDKRHCTKAFRCRGAGNKLTNSKKARKISESGRNIPYSYRK